MVISNQILTQNTHSIKKKTREREKKLGPILVRGKLEKNVFLIKHTLSRLFLVNYILLLWHLIEKKVTSFLMYVFII